MPDAAFIRPNAAWQTRKGARGKVSVGGTVCLIGDPWPGDESDLERIKLAGHNVRHIKRHDVEFADCNDEDARNFAIGRLLGSLGAQVLHVVGEPGGFSATSVEMAHQLGIPVVWTERGIGAAQWSFGTDSERRHFERIKQRCALILDSESGVESWIRAYHDAIGDMNCPASEAIISVVIPTYNRPVWLRRCLAGFGAQTLPTDNYEVIVVDDHSDESVADLVAEYSGRFPITLIRHERRMGPNAARNSGWKAARGEIVLIFDDDDRPTPRLLAEHLRTHLEHPEPTVAVLGFTGWDPDLNISPVMYHVTQVGKQYFCYPDIPAGRPLDWHYYWTGRSSIKRELLESIGGFDEDFPLPALDDIELAYRLRDQGLTVYYNPRAVSYGMRALDTADFCTRWQNQGKGMAIFMQKHRAPELLDHFNIRNAESTWDALEPQMDTLRAEIEKLSARSLTTLRKTPVQLASGATLSAEELLHALLRNYFEGHRVSAYLEASCNLQVEAMPEPSAASPGRNILFLAPELPLFDRSSGGFRLFQIVKMAQAAGHVVTFIAREPGAVEDARPYVQALRDLGVEVYPYDPDKVFDTWGESIDQPRIDLRALLEERRFAVAYCYFFEIADLYREEIREFSPSTRLVVDSVDLHYLREMRHGTLLGDPALIERASHTRTRELASYRAADVVITVTETDKAALLEAAPELAVQVIPNIHPTAGIGRPWAERRDIVFVGGFKHRPNVDAMIVFYHDVWSVVAERLPDARFLIVGADPPESIQALAGDRVIVTGYVPDMAGYLDSSRVSVAPLLYGAGMKGKVGEALAAGLPVVGTTIACEGMDLVDGEHVLVADSPGAMADAIVRVYEDEALWTRLGEAGRQHVERQYSPGAVREAISGLLAPAVQDGSGAGNAGSARKESAAVGGTTGAGAVFKASIVIPVWNRAEFTQKCVEALAESIPEDYSYEVIIVDNGSTDGTGQFLASLEGDVHVIRNSSNLGFARACNQGAKAARGEWIVFLNNDTEPRAGWLEAMIELGESQDRAGIVGAKLLYPDGTIQHAGVVFTGRAEGKFIVHGDHFDKDVFIDLLPYHLYRKMPADAPYLDKVRDFQVVTGACLAIRQELFQGIGGFDEGYRNGFEDVDLCLKALKADWRVVYCPTAVVVHHESKSEGRHDHDLPNARIFHERWRDFVVPDDERYYLEDGFVSEQPQERLTVWRYNEAFGQAEAAFARGDLAAARAAYEAFLASSPLHEGARIRAAVLAQRLEPATP